MPPGYLAVAQLYTQAEQQLAALRTFVPTLPADKVELVVRALAADQGTPWQLPGSTSWPSGSTGWACTRCRPGSSARTQAALRRSHLPLRRLLDHSRRPARSRTTPCALAQ